MWLCIRHGLNKWWERAIKTADDAATDYFSMVRQAVAELYRTQRMFVVVPSMVFHQQSTVFYVPKAMLCEKHTDWPLALYAYVLRQHPAALSEGELVVAT